MSKPVRTTIDLAGYPDLVVIYLGMRAQSLRGLMTLIGFGPKIQASVDAQPDGLLRHESLVYGFFPLHVGMRQYWQNFEALEAWTRTLPHQKWWVDFARDSSGVGFWHEVYLKRGGMEAFYADIHNPQGFSSFAPILPCSGSMFSARRRVGLGDPKTPAPVNEE